MVFDLVLDIKRRMTPAVAISVTTTTAAYIILASDAASSAGERVGPLKDPGIFMKALQRL